MNFKNSILIIFTITIISCKAPEKFDYSLCRTYKVTDPKQVSFSENTLEFNINKTLTELRFCTRHPSILSEIIFEEYGKWDNVGRLKKSRKGALMFWNNLKIKGIDKSLNIITASYGDILSTIMILDTEGNDLLSKSSEYRTYLVDYWTNKINAYDIPNTTSDYTKEFTKEFNPEYYKQLFPNSN